MITEDGAAIEFACWRLSTIAVQSYKASACLIGYHGTISNPVDAVDGATTAGCLTRALSITIGSLLTEDNALFAWIISRTFSANE